MPPSHTDATTDDVTYTDATTDRRNTLTQRLTDVTHTDATTDATSHALTDEPPMRAMPKSHTDATTDRRHTH